MGNGQCRYRLVSRRGRTIGVRDSEAVCRVAEGGDEDEIVDGPRCHWASCTYAMNGGRGEKPEEDEERETIDRKTKTNDKTHGR